MVDTRPSRVTAQLGEKDLELVEVSTIEELEAVEPAPGTATWLYEAAPAIETHAPAGERVLAGMVSGVRGAPRVSVRFPRSDVRACGRRVLLGL